MPLADLVTFSALMSIGLWNFPVLATLQASVKSPQWSGATKHKPHQYLSVYHLTERWDDLDPYPLVTNSIIHSVVFWGRARKTRQRPVSRKKPTSTGNRTHSPYIVTLWFYWLRWHPVCMCSNQESRGDWWPSHPIMPRRRELQSIHSYVCVLDCNQIGSCLEMARKTH